MEELNFPLYERAALMRVDSDILDHCQRFNCGDDDLDDFFFNDVLNYEREMLGKTYAWLDKEDDTKIVGMITLANASIQTTHMHTNPKRKLNAHIPFLKRGRTYPAVLIGRLGVDLAYQGKNFRVGEQIMDFIKQWFRSRDNKTGCRFILVDAVNSPRVLAYYECNGFKPLFPRIEDEKVFYSIMSDEQLRTRMYYFDLM